LKSFGFFAASLLVVLFASNGAVAAPFVSEEGGFSINLPDGWQQLPKEQFDAVAVNGVYLMAINPEAIQKGKNFSIIGTRMPMPAGGGQKTLKEISSEQAEMMKSIPGLKGNVSSEVRSFAGIDWAKLTYATATNGVTVAVTQYTAIIKGSGYTFAFMTDDLLPYASAFDKAMNSFTVK
jgi:hypothetical protein